MTTNCLTALKGLAATAAPEHPATIKPRSRADAPVDAVIYLRSSGDRRAAEAHDRLLQALQSVPWIADVQPRRDTFGLVFTEEIVDRWAAALARGELVAVDPAQGLGARRIAVQFLDANLSKALHVGHMWSVALGEAFASMLTLAGARVTRRLWYADAGRNMFEAVAGVLADGNGSPRLPSGVKSDQYVGRCYADYVGRVHLAEQEAEQSPIDRELARFDDRAEELMKLWFSGDPVVGEHWRLVRGWAAAGQKETLERIGVRFDEPMFQSDAFEDMAWLIREGLRRELLQREDDGRIVYRSPRKEFDAITLVRHDGFPTEYARLITLIWRDQPIVPDYASFIAISGDEWAPSTVLMDEFLERFGPYPLLDKLTVYYHAMMTLHGTKMKSRDGRALLVDQLFDGLTQEPRLRTLAPWGDGSFLDLLANILIRTFFLARHPRKNVAFDWDGLLDDRNNPGWSVCQALCRMRGTMDPGASASQDTAGFRRLLVARALEIESRLLYAVENHDPRSLTKYLLQVAELCLELPADQELSAMGRTLLETLLTALGLPVRPASSLAG
jgi:arginyl-tRNA synthetase